MCAMDKVDLTVPVMLISTKTGRKGETERRFLTPFGPLDITLRRKGSRGPEEKSVTVVVSGAVEEWLMYDLAVAEFRKTLLDLVYSLVEGELAEQGVREGIPLVVELKKSNVRLTPKLPDPPPPCPDRT